VEATKHKLEDTEDEVKTLKRRHANNVKVVIVLNFYLLSRTSTAQCKTYNTHTKILKILKYTVTKSICYLSFILIMLYFSDLSAAQMYMLALIHFL